MKTYLCYFVAFTLIVGCKQPKKDQPIATSQKWGIREITIENFDNHNLISYYQAEGPNRFQGYAEIRNNGKDDNTLFIYDGKGEPIIKSTLQRIDKYSGGYEAESIFFNKPNVKNTSAAMARSKNPFQSKEIAVIDPLIQTHSIIRFIPNFFYEGGTPINGVQYDLPATRESISISLTNYKEPSDGLKK